MAAETIIESFCERCGTRYTFEPARKRESKLVGLGKSLGILLDDQVGSLASRDPFHGTFHFCLECRQYTCPTCWNEAAGFCLGCVPLPDMPDSASFDEAEAAATLEAASWVDSSLAEHAALGTPDAWPDADLGPRHLAALELGATPAVLGAATDPESESPVDSEASDDAPPPLALLAAATADAVDTAVESDEITAEAAPVVEDVVAEAFAGIVFAAEPEEAEPQESLSPEAEAFAGIVFAAEPEEAEPLAAIAEPLAAIADVSVPHDADADGTTGADAVASAASTPEDGVTPEVLLATVAVAVTAVAAHDDDLEADWAHLLGRLPAEEDLVPDDWAAMAPALGPDIAPVPVPAVTPPPPPAPQPPVVPPAAPATPWQLTAPTGDAPDARSTAWPPLGPVFRPAPAPMPAPVTPHPSVMAQRNAPPGVLARGQQAGAVQLPKGVRPCVSCELPLSASARFCRRCGRPQA